jgi:hypothetical protein
VNSGFKGHVQYRGNEPGAHLKEGAHWLLQPAMTPSGFVWQLTGPEAFDGPYDRDAAAS